MEGNNFEKESITNFSENRHSRSDYKKVKNWFASDDDQQLKASLREHWQQIPSDLALNERMKKLLSVLMVQISFRPFARKLSIFTMYQKVAAVLFIPLVASFLFWILTTRIGSDQSMVTIHSTEGARTEFALPDGSKGWLNSGSSLTYPARFSSCREVQLEGEAFFEVVKQHGQTFRVKTRDLSVQVLGTSFNVSAYSDDQEISVVLKEGSVRVLSPDEKEIYTMKPNEKMEFNFLKKSASLSKVDAEELIAWTQGILKFRGEPLSDVVKKLSRWYNVEIQINDVQLQGYNFKATFKNEPLEEILRMIALTTPMRYEIEERQKDNNGIYLRKKITIKRK